MHNFFHQKFDDRWRLCQHEKKISHYEQTFLLFNDRNEFYEILLHFFQMKTKKRKQFDLHSKKISNYNKNNEKNLFTNKKNIWNWNNHWIADQSNEDIIVKKTSNRRLCNSCFHFKKNQKKNIEIYHKSLTKENYFFQSLKKIDFALNVCYDDFNVIITSDCIVIFITNLKISSVKICKNKLINYVMTHKNFKSAENVNFDYENVFF